MSTGTAPLWRHVANPKPRRRSPMVQFTAHAPQARPAGAFARHAASAEALGAGITRLGATGLFAALAVIYFWFGGMKFTAYEAEGLVPLVQNSPLLSWMYDIFSVRGF